MAQNQHIGGRACRRNRVQQREECRNVERPRLREWSPGQHSGRRGQYRQQSGADLISLSDQQLVSTYQQLLKTEPFLAEAGSRLGISLDPGRIKAEVILDTQIIQIKVQDSGAGKFAVTTVNFSSTGGCGGFTATASIVVNKAGTVTYHWVRSDGATDTASHPPLEFSAAGSKSVMTTYRNCPIT